MRVFWNRFCLPTGLRLGPETSVHFEGDEAQIISELEVLQWEVFGVDRVSLRGRNGCC